MTGERDPRNLGKRKNTASQRAKIAKYAADNSNAAALRHYSKEIPGLGESTIRLFKKQYLAALAKKNEGREDINSLPAKKHGRPSTLGALDEKVQNYLQSLRKAGAPINAAEGIVKAVDSSLLLENGGHIALTQSWAYSLMRMGYVKRKATTKTKTSLSKLEIEKGTEEYLAKIKTGVEAGKIPPEPVSLVKILFLRPSGP